MYMRNIDSLSILIYITTFAFSAQGFIPKTPTYMVIRRSNIPDGRRALLRDSVILYHRSSKQRSKYPYDKRTMTAGGFGTSGEAPFEIRGFSLSDTVIGIGSLITLSSFAEYISGSSAGGISGIGFVYGLPILLIGAALKYGEILPVPIKTTQAARTLFELKKTATIDKINKDVTRHRYGDEAHLDTTVKTLGLVVPNKSYPQLEYIEYGIADNGELEFMMVWKSIDTPFILWNNEAKIEKYDTYFGPDVWSKVIKVNGPERLVGIKLTTGERPDTDTPNVPLGVWRMGCENVVALDEN